MKRRPSLASPLPPTPIVPSTPLPRANPSVIQSHSHYQLPAYERPSTASSANPPSTRAFMKRLMAKPAPPLSTSHMNNQINDETRNTCCQDQDLVQEICLPPSSDSLLFPPQSPNEFYKSIRALDLVGQIDISMSPIPTTTHYPDVLECQEPHLDPDQILNDLPSTHKKQRNVLRRRPSANVKNTTASPSNTTSHPSFDTSPIGRQTSIHGRRSIDVVNPTSTTTLITLHPPPLRFPRHSQTKSSPSTRPSTPNPPIPFIQPNEIQSPKKKESPNNTAPPNDPIPPISSHPYGGIEGLGAAPYYTVFGDTSGRLVAPGGPEHAFWDTAAGGVGNGHSVSRDQGEDGGGGGATVGGGLTKVLTRTVSGKLKKRDSNHQVRSNPSYQELSRSSVDNGGGIVGDDRHKLPDSPPGGKGAGAISGGSGDSPSRRFWKLVKKISVGGLREKYQTDSDDPPPPVPPLQNQHRTLHNSRSSDASLTQPRGASVASGASISRSSSSPMPPLGKVYKTPPLPSTPPSTSAHQPKTPHSAPHPSSSLPTTTGPRPSTTTCSSSHSSDVASSRFCNPTQSARSSTSSLGEEAIPLPPLPKTSISATTNGKTSGAKRNDVSASRKLQQHIIPPSELIRDHSTSNVHTTSSTASNTNIRSPTTMSIPIPIQSPSSMEDDWTIVRSPSVELEALLLPPPPRRLALGLKSVGVGHKARGQSKMGVIPASEMLQMVDKSPEIVDDRKNQDASSTLSDRGKKAEEEKPTSTSTSTSTSTKQEQEKDLLEKKQSHSASNDGFDRPPSPIIPSFSTSSAINSFPARRSLSTSNCRSSEGSGVSPMTDRLMPPPSPRPQSPQRPESRAAFGRVRQRLFGTNDDEEDDECLNLLPSSRKSEIQIAHLRALYSPYENLGQQQRQQVQPRRHHRHSSGNTNTSATTIAKSRFTHAAATSSISTPTSPTITFHPHRRSISVNTSQSPVLSSELFASASPPSSLPSPLSPSPPVPRSPQPLPSPSLTVVSAPRVAPLPLPLPPVPVPSPTRNMGHRNRSSSNIRAGFSSKKLTEVLFPSSSPSASPASRSRRPSSASGHRTMGTFMSRSISIGAGHQSNVNSKTPSIPPSPRPPLTDQEKADKWNDLLARSARAGGTLHLAAGTRLLGSDTI